MSNGHSDLSGIVSNSSEDFSIRVEVDEEAPTEIFISTSGLQGPLGPTGPVGPTGPTGAAGPTGAVGPSQTQSFRFEQQTVESIWTISHDLGFRPGGIIVIDSGGNIVEGEIVSNEDSVTVLSFAFAFSGTADLS